MSASLEPPSNPISNSLKDPPEQVTQFISVCAVMPSGIGTVASSTSVKPSQEPKFRIARLSSASGSSLRSSTESQAFRSA